MTTERWESVKELLHQAMQLPPEQRGPFLDAACPSDASLRAEIESLLVAEDDIRASFLQSPPLAGELIGLNPAAIQSGIALEPGQVFAQRFQLVRRLGEGGMGQVWLADQTVPVRRPVALKLIKAGTCDQAIVQRFQAERQSLAIMDHPAIAKVFDAGATEQGQPYFVMEYVPGLPITEYCDREKLTIKRRLELFIQACEGVQHAHQKAIVHRDLKPANILVVEVDGKPVPRIIDFGLAKATNPSKDGESLFTQLGSLVGTPGYMSPEQADPGGQDIDTRTDVYSLGVVLYVLLTGALPLDMKQWQKQPFEALRRLREEEPQPPSAKVSADRESSSITAEARGTEPTQLVSLLRGDLDWITMKALEKDRARRYGTPSDLAADLQRYLKHEPVVARPASTVYRARKYVRRHRVVVAAVAALVLLLAATSVLQTVELRRITRERDRANRERDRATRITDFTTGMFKVSDPTQARGNSITAREILDKASKDIDTELAKDPELQAQMIDVMGNVYGNLGLYPRAQSLFERSVEIRRRVLGPNNPQTLTSMTFLAKSLRQMGRYSEAEKLGRETLETERRVLGNEAPQTLRAMSQLAWTLSSEGRRADAAQLDQEALEMQRRVLGPEDPQVLSTMNDLASILRAEGNYAETERMDRETLEIRQRTLGADHPQTLESMTQLASDLAARGLYSEAEKVDRQTLELARRVYGPEHPYTMGVMANLANDVESEGRYAEAEKLGREALDIMTRVLGPEHPQTVDALDNLAPIERDLGHYAEAEKLDRQALELRLRAFGPDNRRTLQSTASLAIDLEAQGSYTAAEKLERKALDVQRRLLGPENPDTLSSMGTLAKTLAHERKYAEAEKLAHELQEIDRRAFGPQHPDTAASTYILAGIAARTGRREESLARLRESVDHGLAPNLDLGIEKDHAFDSLHGDPRFTKIAADARLRAAAQQKPN